VYHGPDPDCGVGYFHRLLWPWCSVSDLEQVTGGLETEHVKVLGGRHGSIIVEEVSGVNGFVIREVIVTEIPELIFYKLGVLVVVGAVEPVLRIPVPGFVVAFLVGSNLIGPSLNVSHCSYVANSLSIDWNV